MVIDCTSVEPREALLIESENAIFPAARDRARTPEERAWWDEFLAQGETNRTFGRRR